MANWSDRARRATAALALVPVLLAAFPAVAQEVVRIAAVVNGDVITVRDVQQRLRLVLGTSGLQDSPETRQRLVPQVLNNLVDETLKLQDAERRNVAVSDGDIEQAVRRLEQQNGLPAGGLDNVLQSLGLGRGSLERRIRSELAWSEVVRRANEGRVVVDDTEVQDRMERLRESIGKPQYLLYEIVLPVDRPDEDREVRDLAERLATQIRRGADFGALATQFSQAPSAANGGLVGWVGVAELDPEIARAVEAMASGGISDPIRSLAGYTVVGVRDRRIAGEAAGASELYTLLQFVLPTTGPDAIPQDRIEDTLARLRAEVQGCDSAAEAAERLGVRISDRIGPLPETDMAPAIRQVVAGVDAGAFSPAVRLENAVAVLLVCDRSAAGQGDGLPSEAEVRSSLINERFGMLAQHLLRDLRRRAEIDIRL